MYVEDLGTREFFDMGVQLCLAINITISIAYCRHTTSI